ncbi:TPA: hypothetical protein U8203_000528 [Pseudomonas putida]|nr:hypothetical protein [Pseudomonas putida]HEN8715254.1 hypothetical protein [Pseudomonas putida]
MKVRTSELTAPICAGHCYLMVVGYSRRAPYIKFSRRIDYRQEAIPALFENRFIGREISVPRAVKQKVLSATSAVCAWLNSRIITDQPPPIDEPYATLLWCEANSHHEQYQQLKGLMEQGLTQAQAEGYLECYGPDALSASRNDLLSAQVLYGHPESWHLVQEEHNLVKAIRWLESEGAAGRTLLSLCSIPEEHAPAVHLGIELNWIRHMPPNVQLTSHAILQSRLRHALEQFTGSFYPSYDDAEVAFAYTRLMSLQSTIGSLDIQNLLTVLINQRAFSLKHCAGLITEVVEQYSALVQTLHRRAPRISLYSKYHTARWVAALPYEEITVFYDDITNDEGEIHIIGDFELYSVSDFVNFLQGIKKSSQLILMMHANITRYVTSRLFIHSQISTYFPTFALPSPATLTKELPMLTSADLLKQAGDGLVIITDDENLLKELNASIPVPGQTKMVTPTGTFNRLQPVLFEPDGVRTWDSFIGVIRSTSDSGLMVEVEGCVRHLTNEFVGACITSLAYAIEVTQAVRVGLKRGLLVTQRYHEVVDYLKDSGVDVIDHFMLDEARPAPRLPTGQWVMPTVEGESK